MIVSIHTKLVGALDAIIMSLTAAVTVVMLLVLLDPSLGQAPSEMFGKRGTVTIQQLSVDDTVAVRQM